MKNLLLTILGSIFRVDCSEPLVALTFDDGPDPVYTHTLLDLLKKYDAKVTFFLVGEAAKDHPEILKRISSEGHCMGNHGWNHISMAHMSTISRIKQIRKCSQTLGFYESSYFRPPYGHQTLFSAFIVRLLGYEIIGGDVIPEDWKNMRSEDIASNLQANIKPGSIVVLHDRLYKPGKLSHPDRTEMLIAVEKMLSTFGSQFRFVTIKSLLEQGRAELKIWTYLPS